MNDSIDTLLRNFSDLKGLEREAYNLYKKILPAITDPTDQKKLETIMADELRHENMVQGIIDLIQAHP
jgi:rubrerythrin